MAFRRLHISSLFFMAKRSPNLSFIEIYQYTCNLETSAKISGCLLKKVSRGNEPHPRMTKMLSSCDQEQIMLHSLIGLDIWRNLSTTCLSIIYGILCSGDKACICVSFIYILYVKEGKYFRKSFLFDYTYLYFPIYIIAWSCNCE